MQNKREKGKQKRRGEGGGMSGREKEQQRQSKSERERTTFDCVKLYVMTPTASAPGTVLNRSPFPAVPPLHPLPNRQLHMLIHSRIHTAIHPWPARSFPCTVGRRVSLDICQRRGRKSRIEGEEGEGGEMGKGQQQTDASIESEVKVKSTTAVS